MSGFLTKTYLVCNNNTVLKIKKISGFKVNLGQALLTRDNKFNPPDVAIQMHTQFFNEIIHLNGYLGSLHVYTNMGYPDDSISIFNGQDRVDVEINGDRVYDSINSGLKIMGKKTGFIVDAKPEPTPAETVVETEYKRPQKKLEEMSIDERIQFARNRK